MFRNGGNPTHSGILHTAPPPTWSPTGYVGRVRGDGRVLPSPGGSGGGGYTTETRPADLPKHCSEVRQPTGSLSVVST